MKHTLLAVVIFSLTMLSACSLTGDVTPPPDYQAPTSSVQEMVYPILPPDLENGAVIYKEECATCHGNTGRGNGSLASSLPVDVPALGTFSVAFSARPIDWFDLVTNGRMERDMPPFDFLKDRDRWDVVAYALSLHTTQDQLDSVKIIYEQQCQSCHGPNGEGEQAAGRDVADWTQPERLAQLSEDDLYLAITMGAGSMPGFRDTLNDTQRMALAAYVRSLTFASPGVVAEVSMTATPASPSTAVPSASPLDGLVTSGAAASLPENAFISGKVSSFTGDAIPTGLEATLQAYDNMQLTFTQTVPVSDDGSYSFREVELAENRVFLVKVTVQGVNFTSDVLHSNDLTGGETAQLPITIYEVSNDASQLRGDRLHVFFDFTDPEMVQVVELLIFSNPGQEVIAPAVQGGSLLSFTLPEDASDLQFEDGTLGDGTYLQTANGFGVARAYAPGDGYQILFAYNLPYERKRDLELDIPVDIADAIIMVPVDGVRIKSDQLQEAGEKDVQGVDLQLYLSNNLKTDSPLGLTLSGRPPQGADFNFGETSSLLIGAGTFVLVGIGTVIYLIRQRKSRAEPEDILEEETPEALMDAIIALDDRRRAGELDEEAYLTRRGKLKGRLQQFLDEQGRLKDMR
jgi:mono/diheme cytochrome c family protein